MLHLNSGSDEPIGIPDFAKKQLYEFDGVYGKGAKLTCFNAIDPESSSLSTDSCLPGWFYRQIVRYSFAPSLRVTSMFMGMSLTKKL